MRTIALCWFTSQARATREAPAQTELRPTCAVASRLTLHEMVERLLELRST
jgi:hypothetical protein